MPESVEPSQGAKRRELVVLLVAWLLLALIVTSLAIQNLSVPGLYYDEAVFGGMAKDFVTGNVHGPHIPEHQVATFFGRPFPVLVQPYLGALKSWMLMPSLALFGASVPTLRASNLFWDLAALLLLMLATWRWSGLASALVAGLLLAFDPNFFFLSVIDWGAAVPSFLCRCASFYFLVSWQGHRRSAHAFLAGLFAGLGFFNKADFAVLLFGTALAAVCCYWRQMLAGIRPRRNAILLAWVGFFIAISPIVVKLPWILRTATASPPVDYIEKLQAMLSMYDGSYFYRLMSVGGRFDHMNEAPSVWSGLGFTLVAALLLFLAIRKRRSTTESRVPAFLILATMFTTVGVMLVPSAARIHHMVLVYPLPHLFIAFISVAIWKLAGGKQRVTTLVRAGLLLVLCVLVATQLLAIRKTQQLIHDTGGRGWWSDSFNSFCNENRNRSDVTIVSLDWGFNEQLNFLTDKPKLLEPFWKFEENPQTLSSDPHYIYLAHPPEYSEYGYDTRYLDAARNSAVPVKIEPHVDRERQIAFYTIQFQSR
jgi:Dolichyl-phosphate-mannose-protein mannosyltransferase